MLNPTSLFFKASSAPISFQAFGYAGLIRIIGFFPHFLVDPRTNADKLARNKMHTQIHLLVNYLSSYATFVTLGAVLANITPMKRPYFLAPIVTIAALRIIRAVIEQYHKQNANKLFATEGFLIKVASGINLLAGLFLCYNQGFGVNKMGFTQVVGVLDSAYIIFAEIPK